MPDLNGTDAAALSARILDANESQETFRAVLDALSQPGRLFTLPAGPSARVTPAIIPVLALAGHGTSFAVIGGEPGEESLIAHATNGHRAAPTDASFLVILDDVDEALVRTFRTGTSVRPDFAAQVCVKVPGVLHEADAPTAHFSLSGPGVPTERHVGMEGAGDWSLQNLFTGRTVHPCGIDLILVDNAGNVLGVPRTSHVRLAAARTGRN